MSAMPRKRRLVVKASSVAMGHFRTHAVHKYRSSKGRHRSRITEAAYRQQSCKRGPPLPWAEADAAASRLPVGISGFACLAHGEQALPHHGETLKDLRPRSKGGKLHSYLW